MAQETPFHRTDGKMPFEFGALVQGGNGLTEDRDGFHFLMVGAHAGKVLYQNNATGMWRGNFEYAVELFPYWQSFTPQFQRANCTAIPNSTDINCSPLYTVGWNLYRSFGNSDHPALELRRYAQDLALGAGSGRVDLDEPQVSGLRLDRPEPEQ